MSVEDNTTRLRQMLEACGHVVSFSQGESRESLDTDLKLRFAFIALLGVIGEAASRIAPELRRQHPEIDWGAMIGMRNRLIHAYFAIDFDRVWETITIAVPELISQLEALLQPPAQEE